MGSPRLSPQLNVVVNAVQKAGRRLLRDFGEAEKLQVSAKGPGDFVSQADMQAEETLRRELSRARPASVRAFSNATSRVIASCVAASRFADAASALAFASASASCRKRSSIEVHPVPIDA